MAKFDIGGIDEVIHGRLRLGIMAYLADAEVADFTELKTVLEATQGLPMSDANVLFCPSGLPEYIANSSVTSGLPTSRVSAEGAKAVQFESKLYDPGLIVYAWYGINGTSGSSPYMPCRRWPADGTGPGTGKPAPATPKITDIKKSSEVRR